MRQLMHGMLMGGLLLSAPSTAPAIVVRSTILIHQINQTRITIYHTLATDNPQKCLEQATYFINQARDSVKNQPHTWCLIDAPFNNILLDLMTEFDAACLALMQQENLDLCRNCQGNFFNSRFVGHIYPPPQNYYNDPLYRAFLSASAAFDNTWLFIQRGHTSLLDQWLTVILQLQRCLAYLLIHEPYYLDEPLLKFDSKKLVSETRQKLINLSNNCNILRQHNTSWMCRSLAEKWENTCKGMLEILNQISYTICHFNVDNWTKLFIESNIHVIKSCENRQCVRHGHRPLWLALKYIFGPPFGKLITESSNLFCSFNPDIIFSLATRAMQSYNHDQIHHYIIFTEETRAENLIAFLTEIKFEKFFSSELSTTRGTFPTLNSFLTSCQQEHETFYEYKVSPWWYATHLHSVFPISFSELSLAWKPNQDVALLATQLR
jgi:hypothetical protein